MIHIRPVEEEEVVPIPPGQVSPGHGDHAGGHGRLREAVDIQRAYALGLVLWSGQQ